MNEISIIGAGPSGLSCLLRLLEAQAIDYINIRLFEKNENLGIGTPFHRTTVEAQSGISIEAYICALALSMNSSQASLGKWVRLFQNALSEGIICIERTDDSTISRGYLCQTLERPQGWSRAYGQWDHYVVNDTVNILQHIISSSNSAINIEFGHELISLELSTMLTHDQDEIKAWKMIFSNGETLITKSVVVSLPIQSIYPIILPLSPHVIEERTERVLNRCYNNIICRRMLAVALDYYNELSSVLYDKFVKSFAKTTTIEECFQGSKIFEIDTSSIGYKTIQLLSLKYYRKGVFLLIAHFKPRAIISNDSSNKEEYLQQLIDFLDLNYSISRSLLGMNVNMYNTVFEESFQSSIFEPAPLSPLREYGFVIACDDPLLILCGDWASGSGSISGAILSGEKAADFINTLYMTARTPRSL
jgi:hypothetical protein